MELKVTDKIIETVCNSLIASKQSLKTQLLKVDTETKREVIKSQLSDIEEALKIFNI